MRTFDEVLKSGYVLAHELFSDGDSRTIGIHTRNWEVYGLSDGEGLQMQNLCAESDDAALKAFHSLVQLDDSFEWAIQKEVVTYETILEMVL